MKIIAGGYTYDSGKFDVKIGDTVILPVPSWLAAVRGEDTWEAPVTALASDYTGHIKAIVGVKPKARPVPAPAPALAPASVKASKKVKNRTLQFALNVTLAVKMNGASANEIKENLNVIIDDAIEDGLITAGTNADYIRASVVVNEIR